MRDMMAGVYKHWKGHLYLVLGYAHDSNEEGRTVVVYVGLELDGAKQGARLAVRTMEDFHAVVHTEDGTTCYDHNHFTVGEHLPRFTYLGPGISETR